MKESDVMSTPGSEAAGDLTRAGQDHGHGRAEAADHPAMQHGTLQAAFGTNEPPLTAVPSRENGLNPAADPSPGSLCTLRKVMGGVFKRKNLWVWR